VVAMKKVFVKCWKVKVRCAHGDDQFLWITMPDFGDAFALFMCATCGALFAVDPEIDFYLGNNFDKENGRLSCTPGTAVEFWDPLSMLPKTR
jgi:hypothetical protein